MVCSSIKADKAPSPKDQIARLPPTIKALFLEAVQGRNNVALSIAMPFIESFFKAVLPALPTDLKNASGAFTKHDQRSTMVCGTRE